jgi:hypothetical protein
VKFTRSQTALATQEQFLARNFSGAIWRDLLQFTSVILQSALSVRAAGRDSSRAAFPANNQSRYVKEDGA